MASPIQRSSAEHTRTPILISLCAAADTALHALLAHLRAGEAGGGGAPLAQTLALCQQLGLAAGGAADGAERGPKRARTELEMRPAASHLLTLPRTLLVSTAVRYAGAKELWRLDSVCSFFPKTRFAREVAMKLLPGTRRIGWAQLLWRRRECVRRMASGWADDADALAAFFRSTPSLMCPAPTVQHRRQPRHAL